MYLIGIDVGTTAVKAVLVSEQGDITAQASSSYPITSVKTNWFEQDPEDWWRATVICMRSMLASSGIPSSDVGGIGLSGQYHGLVIVDKNLKALRPCIMWNDQRTAKQSAEIIGKVGKERLLRIAGTPGAPYFTACKLYWVKENEPQIYENIYKLMLPKDYVRMKLTGEIVTDVTDASGTLFLDVGARKWSDEMLHHIEVERSILPGLVESPEISGTVTDRAAGETGLRTGCPVAGGGGDQACAAIGNGIVEEGLAAYSIGTSGVIYAATDRLKVDRQNRINSFCHAVPGCWCLLACINAAAGSLSWFEQQFGDWERHQAKQEGGNVYSSLIEQAAGVPPGSEQLFFLPYLAGERHPHTDPDARGAFIGLHSGHTKAHVIRAVLEGVAYSFRDCLEVIRELNVPVREIRATGGGSQSDLWLRIQANTSGEAIRKTNADEGGAAYGAAILSSVGAGIFGDVREACARFVRVGPPIDVDRSLSGIYDRYFQFYRTLYPALKDSYRKLAELAEGSAG